MDIIKIVFTGGPCAGKTTIINRVEEYLREKKYNVISVPETATFLKNIGINLDLIQNIMDFQYFILKMQLSNELIAEQAAKLKNEKVVILYDRGLLDNKAYCGDYKNFDNILNDAKLNEIEILDNYDLVFNLLSTATCAPYKYTTQNNKQREESIEEAKIIDKKTSNAWIGHRNIKIINSELSLEEVFKKVKKEINALLKNENKSIIKKCVINNTFSDFNFFNDNNSRLIKTQVINLNSPNENVNYNLYKRVYKNNMSYLFKVFKEKNGKTITYFNEKISFNQYLDFIDKYGVKNIVFYNQLSFINNNQECNIKFYDDKSILEYEENKEFTIPDFIKVKPHNNKQLLKK